MCSNKQSRVERYKKSSTSAKAKYKVASANFGKSNISGETQEEIDQLCEIGSQKFSEFLSEKFSDVIGQELADKVVQCVDIVSKSGKEALFGSVRVAAEDDKFILDIRHAQGDPSDEYTLKAILFDGPASDYKCETGSATDSSIIGMPIKGSTAIACTKPKGRAVQGTLVFAPKIRKGDVSIKFEAASTVLEVETARQVARRTELVRDQVDTRLGQFDTRLTQAFGKIDQDLKAANKRAMECQVFEQKRESADHIVEAEVKVPDGFVVTGGGCSMDKVTPNRWTYFNGGSITADRKGWSCRTEPMPSFALSREVTARAIGCKIN